MYSFVRGSVLSFRKISSGFPIPGMPPIGWEPPGPVRWDLHLSSSAENIFELEVDESYEWTIFIG